MVGPASLPLREYLLTLRRGMHLDGAAVVGVPRKLVRAALVVAGTVGLRLAPAALDMLERGSTADPAPFARLLGRTPRPVAAFIAPHEARSVRDEAALAVAVPVLRGAISALWLWSAWVSAFIYPHAQSLALLDALGLHGRVAWAALWAGVAVDIGCGVAMWHRPARRLLYGLQAVVVLAYTALVSWAQPAFWTHPFGPLAKNLPILAAILLLRAVDR